MPSKDFRMTDPADAALIANRWVREAQCSLGDISGRGRDPGPALRRNKT